MVEMLMKHIHVDGIFNKMYLIMSRTGTVTGRYSMNLGCLMLGLLTC